MYQTVKAPDFIAQDRHGGYIFRRKIPKALRPHFLDKREIRRSLRTRNRGTAIRLARNLAAQTDQLFWELMRMTSSTSDGVTTPSKSVDIIEIKSAPSATTESPRVHVATLADSMGISIAAALNALLATHATIYVQAQGWIGWEVIDIWKIDREDGQFIFNDVERIGYKTAAHGLWRVFDSQVMLASLIETGKSQLQVLTRGEKAAFFLEFHGLMISATAIYAEKAILHAALRNQTAELAPLTSFGDPLKTTPTSSAINLNTKNSTHKAPHLSSIFDEFKAFKLGGNKTILDTSFDEYKTALDDLIFVCGDVPVDEITFERACEFRKVCQQLPAHRNKIADFMGMSCAELLALNTPDFLNIGSRTIHDRLGYLRTIYNWLVARTTVRSNPFSEVSLAYEKNPYPLLTTLDLTEIFNSALYTESKYSRSKTTRAANWWFPLFSLWSGARPSELAQMRLNDIEIVDSIWTAAVVDDEETGQRTKTEAGRRTFPIHPKLLELGFEEYFERCQKAGHSRVFESIPLGKRKAGEVVGKWFNERYREKHLPAHFKEERKALYCFRCTYITEALNSGVPLRDIQEMVGHEKKDMGATKEYDPGQKIAILRTETEKVRFPELDLSHLKDGWKKMKLL